MGKGGVRAKKSRKTTINRLEDLKAEVRKNFKTLFNLSEEGGKNQFNRGAFLEKLKEEGLDFIDENIKNVKNIQSYEEKFQEGIKKLFDDNEGSLWKVLDFKKTQKDFTKSLENYFNEKTDKNKMICSNLN